MIRNLCRHSRRRPWLRWIALILGVVGALSALFAHAQTTAPAPSSPPQKIWTAEIRGSINPASADFLEKSIEEADQAGAQFLLVELDTPGGLVASVRQMAQAIDQASLPVIVWVNPAGAAATSAGALLMLASHYAVMAPGTNIGAAHPVSGQGKDIDGAMGEKVVNDTKALARSLAQYRGRPAEIAENIVTQSKSLTAQEAYQKKLIDALTADRQELFKLIDGKKFKLKSGEVTIKIANPQVHLVQMSWAEQLLNVLANPNIAAILMTLGMLLLYVEITNPGISVAGVLGGISLIVAFIALQVLPIQIGSVALLVLGMALMIAEGFVASGGILGGGGVLAFTLGTIWLIDPSKSAQVVSPAIWVSIAAGLGAGMAGVGVVAARLKKNNEIVLAQTGGAGQLDGLAGYIGPVTWVDADHNTYGKALLRGEVWNITSDQELVLDQEVEVTEILPHFTAKVKLVSQKS